jgi:cell division protein FtsX
MFFGGGVAIGMTELARLAFNSLSAEWLGPYGLNFQVQPLPWLQAGVGLLLALILGWIAASSAVSTFLYRLRPR